MKKIINPSILQEAKKKFPVGTVFLPAHLKDSPDVLCTVTKEDVFDISENSIQLSMGNRLKNGHDYIELIYDDRHGWAKIISSPVPKNEIINTYSIY